MSGAPSARISTMIRPASSEGAAIVLDRVDKRFGTTHAVNNLSLAVPRGSLCGFLGPNGAGKSTSIRMIMSIIYPDSGQVSVFGGSALSNKDRIGYLPEERGLYRTMRVGEFLSYLGTLKGLTAAAATRRSNDWLERIELPGVAKKRCQELSKGMQQKVQFVAAVLHDPELLILDEPFSGLDPVNARLLIRLIDELHRDGRTIIFSTHQMHTAERLCDRVVLINRGEKLLDASLDEVRSEFNPRTVVVELLNEIDGPRLQSLASSLQHVSLANGALVNGALVDRVEGKNGDEWHVHVDRDGDPQSVISAIAGAVAVRSISLKQVSLEDVFVELVTAGGGSVPPLAVPVMSGEEVIRG